jgi:hypothetical protein
VGCVGVPDFRRENMDFEEGKKKKNEERREREENTFF